MIFQTMLLETGFMILNFTCNLTERKSCKQRGSKRPMLSIVKFNTTNPVYNVDNDEKSYLYFFAYPLLWEDVECENQKQG